MTRRSWRGTTILNVVGLSLVRDPIIRPNTMTVSIACGVIIFYPARVHSDHERCSCGNLYIQRMGYEAGIVLSESVLSFA